MFFKQPICFIAALLLGAATLTAQTQPPKYGHMNLGNLLEQLPETQKANIDLKFFADKMTAKDDSLNKAFETAYKQLEQEYNAKSLTQVQVQERSAELEKQQAYIKKFEQDAQKSLDDKRGELLQPILAKVQDAIKAVAKENGYLMVFDVSSGAMLFAEESVDISALVKKKLGL